MAALPTQALQQCVFFFKAGAWHGGAQIIKAQKVSKVLVFMTFIVSLALPKKKELNMDKSPSGREIGSLDVVSPQCAYVRRARRPNYAQSCTTDVNANCVQSVTYLDNIQFYLLSGMNGCTSHQS